MIGSVCTATPCEVTGKVELEVPAATTTALGTVAADVMVLDRNTVVFTAATPVKVTLPTLFCTPPMTDVGVKDTDLITAAFTVYV